MKQTSLLPLRRFRLFRDGDKESDRWCSAYPDYVEVFSHKPDGKGGIIPNPEFRMADFELAYVVAMRHDEGVRLDDGGSEGEW